jgi:hypothetical protein
MGNLSFQQSKFDVIQDEANEFVMNENDTPEKHFGRLTTLVVSMRDHGSKDMDGSSAMSFAKNMSSISTNPRPLRAIHSSQGHLRPRALANLSMLRIPRFPREDGLHIADQFIGHFPLDAFLVPSQKKSLISF